MRTALFFKLFACLCFFASCSDKEDPAGPYAEARFLPYISTGGFLDSHTELVAANQRLIDEMLAARLLNRVTKALNENPPAPTPPPHPLCTGRIENGVAIVRCYSPDKRFCLSFLSLLIQTFKEEKNTAARGKKPRELERVQASYTAYENRLKLLEDSLLMVKKQYGIATTTEEQLAALQNNSATPDSAGMVLFNQLMFRLQAGQEEMVKLMRQRDDLLAQTSRQLFDLFMVQKPVYINR